MAFAKKMMEFPSDLGSFSTKLPSKIHVNYLFWLSLRNSQGCHPELGIVSQYPVEFPPAVFEIHQNSQPRPSKPKQKYYNQIN